MRTRVLLLALLLAAAPACVTYDRGSLAAVSTTLLPLQMSIVADDVEGKACGDVFESPVKVAIDDALAKSAGANALIDVTYGFEQLCMVVHGTAVRVD